MLNVYVYVLVRKLVCENERARGEVLGLPIQFFTISLGKVRLHNCLNHFLKVDPGNRWRNLRKVRN